MSGRAPFAGTNYVSLSQARALLRGRTGKPVSKAILIHHVKRGALKPDAVVSLPTAKGSQLFYGFTVSTLRVFAVIMRWSLSADVQHWT